MHEEKKRILEMVKEGLLNADEALILLEQIEKKNESDEVTEKPESRELSTVVQQDNAQTENQSTIKKTSSALDKFMGIVDGVVKKIKDVDFDFNFGPSVDISHIYHHEGTTIRHIDIDIANGEVTILPSNQHTIDIECDAKIYRVENTTEAREKLLKEVTYSVKGDALRFAVQERSIKLNAVIRVPNVQYDEMKIRLFNGSITGEKMKVDTIKTKTGNGSIKFQDIFSKDAEFETVNGSIKLHQFEIGELEVETMNGAIEAEGAYRKSDLQTINGNIKCIQTGHYGETIRAKASTGSITLNIPETASCDGELKSSLGGFNMDLKGIQIIEEKNDVVQKLLRFQSNMDTEHSMHILAESKTGSIQVKHV